MARRDYTSVELQALWSAVGTSNLLVAFIVHSYLLTEIRETIKLLEYSHSRSHRPL